MVSFAKAGALVIAIVVSIFAWTISYRVVCHPRVYCTLGYHWRTPGVKVPVNMMLIAELEHRQPMVGTSELSTQATNTTVVTDSIPRVIYQTYHSKHLIPAKVDENMKIFAPQFTRHVYNDSECYEFLRKHFHRSISDMFYQLEGPHRSDVFRYAMLYINGGVYIDIKTELLVPLVTIISKKNIIFPAESSSTRRLSQINKAPVQRDIPVITDKNSAVDRSSGHRSRPITFSVLSGGSVPRTLFQGVLASPRGNPLFLRLVQDFLESTKPIRDYFITTRKIYEQICDATSQRNLSAGLNTVSTVSPVSPVNPVPVRAAGPSKSSPSLSPSLSLSPSSFDYYLFEEKKRRVVECYDGADRHHGCYFIFRGDDKIMKVRYADYPWDQETKRAAKTSSQFPVIIDLKKWGA